MENFEKSFTRKTGENIPCRYSKFTIWVFYGTKIKLDGHTCEDCMKNVCESLREHAMKIINFKKKKLVPLTNEQQESYENLLYLQERICKLGIIAIIINENVEEFLKTISYKLQFVSIAQDLC